MNLPARFRLPCLVALMSLTGAVEAASLSVSVRLADGTPLSGAVVSAHPLTGKLTGPADDTPIEVRQEKKRFRPYITAIQAGTRVVFSNSDGIKHHVYSFSAAKRFDLKLFKKQVPEPIVFDEPGEVVIGCNIHDWMLGYLYVLDTPWFGQTDTGGMVTLTDLPDGQYRVEVRYPLFPDDEKVLSRDILLEDATQTLEFRPSGALKPMPDLNPPRSKKNRKDEDDYS